MDDQQASVKMTFDSVQLNEILESYITENNTQQNRTILGYSSARLEVSSSSSNYAETQTIDISSTIDPIVIEFKNIQSGSLITITAKLIITTETEDFTIYEGSTEFCVDTGVNDVLLTMQKKVLEISFNANGGSGSMANIICHESELCSLPECTFSKDDYVFIGWSLSADSKTVTYLDCADFVMEDTDVTLYAVWSKTYSITYVYPTNYINGLTIIPNNPASYTPPTEYVGGKGVFLPNVTELTFDPQLTGQAEMNMILDGWYDNSDFTGEKITKIDENQEGDKTYYASLVPGYCGDFTGLEEFIEKEESWYLEKIVVTGNVTSDDIAGTISDIGHIALDLSYSNLEELPDSAFEYCSSFISITLPSTLTSIGEKAFYGCSSLTGVYVDDENKDFMDIDGVLFSKTGETLIYYPSGKTDYYYIIPDSVTTIGNYAFSSALLTNIIKGINVETIGVSAFEYCSSLVYIEPNLKLTSIGISAFADCSLLTSITIPSSVTDIGEKAFYNCSGLTRITIPSSVTYIGAGAFGSTGLTELIFEDINTWYYVKDQSFWLSAMSNNNWDSVITCDFTYENPEINASNYSNTYSSYYLYRQKTYITYDANGATSGTVPTVQYKEYVVDLIISENTGLLAKEGEHFIGWYTSANGTETFYQEGASYSDDCTKPVTLYAQWITTADITQTFTANKTKMLSNVYEGNFGLEASYYVFGDYPQTIKDSTVAVTKTTETIQGREYHLGNDGYYYVEVQANPYDSTYTFSNGSIIEKGKKYYFKVESIKWCGLNSSFSVNNEVYQCNYAENILDCCTYFDDTVERTINDAAIYPSNYQYSKIRAYLNDLDGSSYNVENFDGKGFLTNAFTTEALEKLAAIEVDNSSSSMIHSTDTVGAYINESYVCSNTNDKVFLLSRLEMTNIDLGFNGDFQSTDSTRNRQPTDYAKAKGAYVSTSEDSLGYGNYFLRSPYYEFSTTVSSINPDGVLGINVINEAQIGFVPVIYIK